MLKYISFNSLIGEIGVVWEDNTHILKQVLLPEVSTGKQNYGKIRFKGVIFENKPDDFVFDLMSKIKNVVLGKNVEFNVSNMDLSYLTDFQKDVLYKQSQVPFGKVVSYKVLAEAIGKPKSARPVANVLSNNAFPLVIPCHRTVRSDWTVGGYAGNTDGEFKKLILENEGIKIENGIISNDFRMLDI